MAPGDLVRLSLPQPDAGDGIVNGSCIAVDRYGNVQLNMQASDLEEAGIEPGSRVEIVLANERYYAVAAETFSDVGAGEIAVYEDAYENISIAISRGSAAETLAIAPGDTVAVRRM